MDPLSEKFPGAYYPEKGNVFQQTLQNCAFSVRNLNRFFVLAILIMQITIPHTASGWDVRDPRNNFKGCQVASASPEYPVVLPLGKWTSAPTASKESFEAVAPISPRGTWGRRKK